METSGDVETFCEWYYRGNLFSDGYDVETFFLDCWRRSRQEEERLGHASWASGRDAHVGPDAGTSARRVDFLRDLAFAPSQNLKRPFFAGALRAPATHGGPRPLRGGTAGRQALGTSAPTARRMTP